MHQGDVPGTRALEFYSRSRLESSDEQVSPETIGHAFQALDGRDMVIGPAIDGGYYLIGLRGPQTGLFMDIDWGTERVFRQTIQRSDMLGLSVEQLQPLEDVDTHADAYRLWRDLRSQASHRASSPRTEATLQRIFDRSESLQRGVPPEDSNAQPS